MCGGRISVLVAVTLTLTTTSCRAEGGWSVERVRDRRPGEISFEESSGYTYASRDRNRVPGPDSLVARVRIDDHRPHLELVDLRTETVMPLVDGYASLPHWSPDGTYISCVVWTSISRPHELVIIDVASRQVVVDPDVPASGTDMKWSPDGRMLAASGNLYGRPRGLVYVARVPDGHVAVLDTLEVISDPQLSWSPNSRWLAFTKPVMPDDTDEDPVAAELWIAEPATGDRWQVTTTDGWIEANPRWITNRSILLDRAHWNGSERGVETTVVLELATHGVVD